MSQSELENCLRACLKKDNEIISSLRELIDEIQNFQENCQIAKTTGTVTAATGTGLILGSLALAPFTGGVSLVLGGAGVAASIGGGATTIVTDIIDSNKTKEIMSRIEDIVASKADVAKKLNRQMDNLNKIVEKLTAQGVSSDIAFATALRGIVNRSGFDPENALHVKTLLIGCQAFVLAQQSLLKTGLMVGGKSISALDKLLGIGLKSSQVLKTAGKFLVGLSVILTVVDVAFLIKDWNKCHPTEDVVSDLMKQLKEEIKNFQEFLSAIDMLKERVWITTIKDAVIVGTNKQFNNALVTLIDELDIREFIELFQELKLKWPFKELTTLEIIVRFLIEHQIAKGYKPDAIRSILKKSGQKAKKAVRTLIEELLKEIEASKKEEDKKGDKKHKRGEHVINNSVLNVQRNILDMFIDRSRHFSRDVHQYITPGTPIYNDYHHTFNTHTQNNIQTRMVAHIPAEMVYIDGNAVLYGSLIQIIRESAVAHMEKLMDLTTDGTSSSNSNRRFNDIGHTGTAHTANIETSVLMLNENRAYVDEVALQYWLREGGDNFTFEQTRSVVQAMFQNLYENLRKWVIELRRHAD